MKNGGTIFGRKKMARDLDDLYDVLNDIDGKLGEIENVLTTIARQLESLMFNGTDLHDLKRALEEIARNTRS
jgi:hypothetical protein